MTILKKWLWIALCLSVAWVCRAGSVTVYGTLTDDSGAYLYGCTARLYCGSYSYGGTAADTAAVDGRTFNLYASRYSGPAVVTVGRQAGVRHVAPPLGGGRVVDLCLFFSHVGFG